MIKLDTLARWALVAGAATVFTACTTLEERCQRTNWYAVGQTDGRKGLSEDHLGYHEGRCGAYTEVDGNLYRQGHAAGVAQLCSPETAYQLGRTGRHKFTSCPKDLRRAYHASWERGLDEYCSVNGGFEAGRSGVAYQGVCPKERENVFLKTYALGREMRTIENEIASFDKQISKIDDDLLGAMPDDQRSKLEFERRRAISNKRALERRLDTVRLAVQLVDSALSARE